MSGGEARSRRRGALLAAGVPRGHILEEPDEEAAARRLLEAAQPGDVVVLPVHTRAVRERIRASLEA